MLHRVVRLSRKQKLWYSRYAKPITWQACASHSGKMEMTEGVSVVKGGKYEKELKWGIR
jgi:hypothetical protein